MLEGPGDNLEIFFERYKERDLDVDGCPHPFTCVQHSACTTQRRNAAYIFAVHMQSQYALRGLCALSPNSRRKLTFLRAQVNGKVEPLGRLCQISGLNLTKAFPSGRIIDGPKVVLLSRCTGRNISWGPDRNEI